MAIRGAALSGSALSACEAGTSAALRQATCEYDQRSRPNCIWRGSRVRVACPKFEGTVALTISVLAPFNTTDEGKKPLFNPANRKFVLLKTLNQIIEIVQAR